MSVIAAVVVLAGCRVGESEDAGSVTVNPGAGSDQSDSETSSITSGSCPVTVPKRKARPTGGIGAADFNYGSTRLRAELYWPRGTLAAGTLPDGGSMAVVNPDGSISAKVGWWRGHDGRLTIEGRRLDATAPPLVADVPDGYGSSGLQPTGLTFPTIGCWRIVGKVGTARLAFVVRVTKLGATG